MQLLCYSKGIVLTLAILPLFNDAFVESNNDNDDNQ